MKMSCFFLLLQKRWSGAASLGEAWDRLNATHRSRGKDYYMGCVWFFPDLSGFGITFSAWKDGISLLRRISCRSAAPWCTEPPLGSLPRATAPCSMPVTSRRGNITPRTYQWLPTQVSQSSAMWCLSQRNAAGEMLIFGVSPLSE